MARTRWNEVTYPDCVRDTKFQRRDKLVAWKEGRLSLQVCDTGGEIAPGDVDWRGCIRMRDAGDEARSLSVLMRVSPSERELLARAAHSEGQPLTTWIRAVVLQAASLRGVEALPER